MRCGRRVERRMIGVWIVFVGVCGGVGCGASVPVYEWPSMRSLDYGGVERFVEVEGRQIAFVDEGEVGAPVLVLVHPWAGSVAIWDGVVPALLGGYRVVRLDIPGHGKSDKPLISYDIDLAARAVVGLMDHLALERVTLIGNSLGGGISLAVMRDHPERVEGLVLIDALGGGTPPGGFGFMIQQFFTAPMLSGVDDGLIEFFTNWFVFEAFTPYTDAFLTGLLSSRASGEGYTWSLAVSSYLRSAVDYDATPWLSGVKVPTLVVWGDSDWVIWMSGAERLRDGIEGAHLTIIEGCGHMPEVERPEVLSGLILDFLAGRPLPERVAEAE